MGFKEENPSVEQVDAWRRSGWLENGDLKRDEIRRKKIADAAAERAALWALADEHMPPDVRDLAARWRLPWLAEFVWCSAFVVGWRAAMSARIPPSEAE